MSGIDTSIAGLTALKSISLNQEISVAVAGKQLDAQKQQGEAVVELLDAAAQLSKSLASGGNIDVIG